MKKLFLILLLLGCPVIGHAACSSLSTTNPNQYPVLWGYNSSLGSGTQTYAPVAENSDCTIGGSGGGGGPGALTYVPAGSTLGTSLGTQPGNATGVRLYLNAGQAMSFTIAPSQPTLVPGSAAGGASGANPMTVGTGSTFDTTNQKFGTSALAAASSASTSSANIIGLLNTTTYTIEGWEKLAAPPSGVEAIFGTTNTPFVAMNASGHIYADYWTGAQTQITSTAVSANGTWVWVALYVSPAGANLCVNSTLAATSATAAVVNNNATVFGVGAWGFGGVSTYNWTGEVDEVVVRNDNPFTGTCTPPSTAYATGVSDIVGLYHLDGAASSPYTTNGYDSSQAPLAAGPPLLTINNSSATLMNWDEDLSGQNIYVTAITGQPSYRWH